MMLQFNLKMLSGIVCSTWCSKPSKILFNHMDKLCSVLDKTLILDLKEEYVAALNVLGNLLENIVQTRPLQKSYTSKQVVIWSKEEFQWAKPYELENLNVEWYVPQQIELTSVEHLLNLYLMTQLKILLNWVDGNLEMSKEKVLRSLTQIYRIIESSSELLPSITNENLTTMIICDVSGVRAPLKNVNLKVFSSQTHILMIIMISIQYINFSLLHRT